MDNSLDFNQDSVIVDAEKMINTNGLKEQINDNSILEINIQKYLNLNPVFKNLKKVNFNMIVIGQSDSGKSSFIELFLNKLRKSCNNTVNTHNSSTNENSDSNINYKEKMKKNINFNQIEEALIENKQDEEEEKNDFNEKYLPNKLLFTTHSVKVSTNKFNKFNIIECQGYSNNKNKKKWLYEIVNHLRKRVFFFII